MSTINVVNGAKYFFDVQFTVPANSNFTQLSISDTLALGFDVVGVADSDIIITDGTYATYAANVVREEVGVDTGVYKISFDITDKNFTNPATEVMITASFPVFVTDEQALIEASPITNTAILTADDATYTIEGTFNVAPATLALFTRKGTITNVTTDIVPIVISFPALDTHPTTNADYTLSIHLSPDLANPGIDAVASAALVEGYLQVEGEDDPVLINGTDFTAVYTMRDDTTDPLNPVGGIFEIIIHQQSRFRNHTLFFYVPTTLQEVLNPLPNPNILGSPVSLSILGLADTNYHLTEINEVEPSIIITPGNKVIR